MPIDTHLDATPSDITASATAIGNIKSHVNSTEDDLISARKSVCELEGSSAMAASGSISTSVADCESLVSNLGSYKTALDNLASALSSVKTDLQGIRDQATAGGLLLNGETVYDPATVMAARHNLTLPPGITSDCAPLSSMVEAMLKTAPRIAVLRDPTRGGAAASLNEIANAAGVGILLDEEAIPVRPEVEGVCELLGFDPLTLANEGKLLAFVPPEDTARVLAVMHENAYGKEAVVIGETTADAPGAVGIRTPLGGVRVVDMPAGELVPRIC